MADRRLQVFYTVARLLSFTKAAEALHMTQPAVTFQVKQLEEQFNTRLFDRTHNRISLTDAGRVALDYATRILGLYGEMESRIGEMTGEVRGLILVAASTTIAEYLLPRILGDFKVLYPEVQVRLMVSNTDRVVHMVEDNTVDLGVVESSVSNKSLVVRKCCMDQMVAVFPKNHVLAHMDAIPPEELLSFPFVLREEGSGTREVTNDYLASHGMDPADMDVTMELGSPEAVKGAVEGGLGISVVSESTVRKEIVLGTLIARPLAPQLVRPFQFVYQKQKFRSHAMEQFLDFAKTRCSEAYASSTVEGNA